MGFGKFSIRSIARVVLPGAEQVASAVSKLPGVGMADKPQTPAAPPAPPSPENKDTAEALENAAALERRQRGRAATIVSGAQGDSSQAPVARRVLLGF